VTCPSCAAQLEVRAPDGPVRVCPACGEAAAPGAVICVHCGLNLRTGTPTHTALEDAAEPEEERPPSLPVRAVMLVGEWTPGLLRPVVLLLSVVVGLLGLGILAFGIGLLGMGAVISCFAVGAAGVIVYAHAAAWIVDGEVSLLSEALTNFEGGRWLVFFVLLALPFVSVFLLVKCLLAAS